MSQLTTKWTWSPAIAIEADKAAFYGCGFVGVQDTLTDWIGRHFFKSCYIQGSVDFIWGQGQSVYQVYYNYDILSSSLVYRISPNSNKVY